MPRKDAKAESVRRRLTRQRLVWLAGGSAVLATCLLIRQQWGPEPASAQAPPRQARTSGGGASAPEAAPARRPPDILAVVNGQEIRRDAVARICAARYGQEVLESLVNKHLIAQHCQQRKIVITRRDVETEIGRIAEKFHLGREQWLEMLQKERGVNPEQYARDIIWPTLALRRLAADRLEVSDAEFRAAYESEFGEAVQARLITVEDPTLARRLHAQLLARPDDFERLAREHSTDINSGSIGGMLQPIRRHAGDDKVEQVLFQMEQGQVSPIVQVGEQLAIFKCEGRIPARRVDPAQVREALQEKIRERKLRSAANDIFEQLQETSVIENVINDPSLSKQMPGVAARINGHPITLRELADECLARHGEEVLGGEINRLLLQQALAAKQIEVEEADLQAEIAHAAELADVVDEQGRPDIRRWVKMIQEEQGASYEEYVRDAVWPSAALKKLVAAEVRITDEDMQKGFEANYGPRVRVRAIVLNSLRRAQEVWDKARRTPTVENFGKLAEEYSIEAGSAALRGEVPPIRRHGGQPLLEREAYRLQPGEISGVIQAGDKFVILYCEGVTKPVQVDMAEVRELIRRDLREKKLRLAMADGFEQFRARARIDNYLTGSSQSPARPPAKAGAADAPPRR